MSQIDQNIKRTLALFGHVLCFGHLLFVHLYLVVRALIHELNKDYGFKGELIGRDNIDKPIEDLVTMWNEANPDDPVV